MRISFRTISIDELRRNFGSLKKELPFTVFTLTDKGKPIAILKATPESKKEMLMATAGALKGTAADSDRLWKDVQKKKSRKNSLTL